MRRIAPLLLIAVLLPAAPAAAHWSTTEMRTTVAGSGAPAAAPRAAGAPLLPLSDTFCGQATTTDETADDTTLPHFKVVYAYPTDSTNRFETRKNLIESKMQGVNAAMNAASDGRRELRLDTEAGACGRYVDILTVALPHEADYYGGSDPRSFVGRLQSDLEAKLAPTSGSRNYVVWADMGCPFTGARTQSYCAGGIATTGFTLGPRVAIVWGDDEPSGSFGNGASSTFDIVVPLHEMLHTLGAVNPGAPHVTSSAGTPLGHCWQEDDLMCQNEGDHPVSLDCPNMGGDESLVVDCGQDDYFNVDPPPGNFLAANTFANTANSSLMIAPPRAALTLSKATATAGETITLDASGSKDDNLDRASFAWDFEGDGVVDQTTTVSKVTHVYPAGSFRPGVTVTDAESMGSTALATLDVAAVPGPPPPPVATPASVASLALSPATFRAAAKGASVAAAKPKPKPVGTTVKYRLDKASTVTFAAEQLLAGKLSGKACVAPSKKLRKAKGCTRAVAVKGTFTRTRAAAGPDSFKFTGRVGGKPLRAGAYALVATPARGKAVRAKFTLAK